MEIYALVRRAVLAEGMSKRAAAKHFGIDRKTVDKICSHSAPPGYRRAQPARRSKLGPYLPVIDGILDADWRAPRKQRHTAKRIFDRLREEHGFDGGYTTVKNYVRLKRIKMKEAFVPLAHPPGHAQVDFGEALAVIAGKQRKVAMFVMSLPYSDAAFVKVYPQETAEAWCDGHVAAFAHFEEGSQKRQYRDCQTLRSGERVRRFAETMGRRANLCMARAMPPPRQGLGMPQRQGPRLYQTCIHPTYDKKALFKFIKFPD